MTAPHMQVVARDGLLHDYDYKRIESAVSRAFPTRYPPPPRVT